MASFLAVFFACVSIGLIVVWYFECCNLDDWRASSAAWKDTFEQMKADRDALKSRLDAIRKAP